MSPLNANTILLAEWAVEFLNIQKSTNRMADMTSKSYAVDLNQFLFLEKGSNQIRLDTRLNQYHFDSTGFEVTGCTPAEIWAQTLKAQQFWAHLEPSSRSRKLSCLKSFFRWLSESNKLEINLGERLSTPKIPQKIPHFISFDEVSAVLKSFDVEKPEQKRDRALFLLLYGGGLRVSEVCHLKRRDIDQQRQQLSIKGKGEKPRLVPLPSIVMESLNEKGPSDEYVFGGDQALSTRKAYDIVRDAGARAGLSHPLHPHALRHSYATHLLNSGMDLRLLQELLGHKNIQTTQKYTHLSLNQLYKTLEKHHPLSKAETKKVTPDEEPLT